MSVVANARKRLKIGLRALRLSSRACRFVETAIAEDEVIAFLKTQNYNLPELQIKKDYIGSQCKNVWQFWGQGVEAAPQIVKACVNSVSTKLAHLDHVVLTRETVREYVDIPEYILEKYEKKIISEAQFSDIIRLLLLSSYGGTWIDATVLLTQPPPDIFFAAPFFCFSSPTENLLGGSRILGSSWFLHAAKEHPLVVSAKNIMLTYWEKNNELVHYYLLHLIFSYLVETNCSMRKEWEKIPFFSSVPPHVLQFELSRPFDQNRFRDILGMSAVHKLTYYGISGDRESGMMTFYDYLTTRFGEDEHVI